MNERRTHIRVPVGVEGTYQLLGSLVGPRLGMTQDISLGGLRISSTDRMQPGDKVAINLGLPKEGQVSMTGVVVWSRQSAEAGQANYEAGLRWLEVDVHTQARLNSFITDFTRSRSSSITTRDIIITPPIQWARAIILAAAVFTVLWIVFSFWQERLRLRAQVESLQAVSENYRNQAEYLSQQRSGSRY